MFRRNSLLWLAASLAFLAGEASSEEPNPTSSPPRLILAHYMPWYEAKPVSPSWGWHWTMNAFDPEKGTDGKWKIASHFYPLIGPYDSGDPHVLEYHFLLMKLAGIDGVIVDWYGRQDYRDYATLHRNTSRLVDQVTRLGMRLAVCYEDQTIPALVEAGRVGRERRVAHAVSDINWLAENWFTRPGYVHVKRRPLLLSFGQTGLTDEEWMQVLAGLEQPAAYFSQHHRRAAALGAFDWPIPSEGLKATERFQKEPRAWSQSIPVAFPRFVDIYAEAKVQRSWGRIEDNQGATFKTTLQQALATGSPVIQIATWNDCGEGTMVEPSAEFGYRDLEVVQEMRRKHVDSRFSATPSDLRLPHRLLMVRRKATAAQRTKQLDQIAELVAAGRTGQAESELAEIEGHP